MTMTMQEEKLRLPQQIPVWYDRRRDNFPSGSIEGQEVDVAVVGGGLAGVMTALELALLGTEGVLILEDRGLAERASGRNGGHVNPGNFSLEKLERIIRDHRDQGMDVVKALLDFEKASVGHLEGLLGRLNINCDLRRTGYVSLASEQGQLWELQEQRVLLEALGHPPELWDVQQCLDAGFQGVFGGLFKPWAAQLHPVRLVLGLARAAQQMGVQIRVMTEVYEVITQEGGGFILQTSKGNVGARIVVHATSRPFLGEAAAVLASGFVPIRGQLIGFEPVLHREIGFGAADGLVYGLWRREGLLLGGMRHKSPSREKGEVDDSRVNLVIGRELRKYAVRDLGIPQDTRVTNEWTGIMWESPDELPVVGLLPDAPGQYAICGFGGHGLPGIPGAARALAQMIRREAPELPLPRLYGPRHSRFTGSV